MSTRSSYAFVAAAVLGLVVSARAATVEALTLEEMTQRAPVIVRGKVVSQQFFTPDGSKRVYTDTELRITESIKGGVDGNILVRQPGGVIADHLVKVEGAANFVEGEDVVLFLSAAPKSPGVYLPLALSASKVSLIEKVGALRAVRRLDGLAFVRVGAPGEGVRPMGGDEDLGSAETFLANLRRWVTR